MKTPYYITTPIYYPSADLHIGNAYTTIIADTIARYKKLRGFDVKFLTGTDEHGQKIQRIAEEAGISPKEYVDKIVAGIRELWDVLEIEYDLFIRTTDDYHEKAIQKIFNKLYEKGDIYKGYYEGWYCTPDEAFFTEHQLVDGKCPDCGRPVEKAREESYFFKLSKYADRLIELYENNPDFIQPKSRQNEMLNNFLKPGLEDLAVSRTSFKWGVPVEFDPGHVVYVWVDALSNYITALGYTSDDDSLYQRYWPADLHLMGKEIVRFHSIIWPAMLMALELPLPKQIFGHGWLTADGEKMSKSLGNVIDPRKLVARYGVDPIRYYLLREVVFGSDGDFSNKGFLQRINSDLANDLGNLVSRTVSMIEKYFDGQIPQKRESTDFCQSIEELAVSVAQNYEREMDTFSFGNALNEVWNLVRRTNKYIDETAPWILAKNDENKAVLASVMYHLVESLRFITVMLIPVLPNTVCKIKVQVGIPDELMTWDSIQKWGLFENVKVSKGDVIFPRLELDKELEAIKPLSVQKPAKEPKEPKEKVEITINDFAKVELKVGRVVECELMKGSEKLLKSRVQIGDEERQIISGIAKFYSPEEMKGKTVVVVTNLKPAKLFGEMSYGMILAAEDSDGRLSLVTVDGEIENGSEVR